MNAECMLHSYVRYVANAIIITIIIIFIIVCTYVYPHVLCKYVAGRTETDSVIVNLQLKAPDIHHK